MPTFPNSWPQEHKSNLRYDCGRPFRQAGIQRNSGTRAATDATLGFKAGWQLQAASQRQHAFASGRRRSNTCAAEIGLGLKAFASAAELASSAEGEASVLLRSRYAAAAVDTSAESGTPLRLNEQPSIKQTRTAELADSESEEEAGSGSVSPGKLQPLNDQETGRGNAERITTPFKRSSPRPVVPDITPEDEAQGTKPGYYFKMLTDTGLLLPVKTENIRHNGFVLNEVVTRLSSWQAVLHVFRDLRHCTDNVSTATVMHRLAKLSDRAHADLRDIRRDPTYTLLLKVVKKKFKGMKARAKANVMWALGTLGEAEECGVMDHCTDIIAHDGLNSTWKAQELSNTAWALCTLERRPVELLKALAHGVIAQDTNLYEPQAIANLAWAFSGLNFGQLPREEHLKPVYAAFYEKLAEGAWHRLDKFSPQAISNTIWSFGYANYYHEKLCEGCNAKAVGQMDGYGEQEISNTLIGLTRLNALEPAVIERLEQEIAETGHRRFPRMKHQVFANVLWCLGTVRHYSEPILKRFTPEIVRRMHLFDHRELSGIMWGFAKLGYHPGQELLEAFDKHASKDVRSFNAQSTSNILWALAVLQAPYLPCYQSFIDHLGTMDIENLDVVQIHQLFQALLLANFERKYNSSSSLRVPKDVLELTTRVWKRLQGRVTVSDFQRDVSERLNELGIEHVQEYQAERGLFSIDIAFSGPDGMRVAMEVDGPYHFTRNTRAPLGSTLLRHRLLRALGWKVVSIPWHHYFQCEGPFHKYEYLAQQLEGINIQIDPERIQKAVEVQLAQESESSEVTEELAESGGSSRAGSATAASNNGFSVARSAQQAGAGATHSGRKAPFRGPTPMQRRHFSSDQRLARSLFPNKSVQHYRPKLVRRGSNMPEASVRSKQSLEGPGSRNLPLKSQRALSSQTLQVNSQREEEQQQQEAADTQSNDNG